MKSDFALPVWTGRLTPVLLAAIVAVFFASALFGNQIILFGDLIAYHYPLKYYWIENLWKGFPPFLNLGVNGGQPILSNPNYAVFYPGNVLYFLLPFETAWNWSLAGHVFWAAVGLYRLTRESRMPRSAALAGALAFAFSGPVLSAMSYYNLLIAVSWTPWILALYLKSIGNRRWMALAAFAWGAQLLSGEPTVPLVTALLVLAVACSLNIQRKSKLQSLLIVLVGGLVISAVQLLPALLWLPKTSTPELLNIHPPALNWRIVFSGLMPVLLLPFAWKSRAGRIGVILAAVSLLFSIGPLYLASRSLLENLPQLRLICLPERFSLFLALGCSIAIAAGIAELRTRFALQRSLLWLPLLLTVVFIDVAYFSREIPQTRRRSEVQTPPQLLTRLNLTEGSIFHPGDGRSQRSISSSLDPAKVPGSLSPMTGLRWGLSYGATSDIGCMEWQQSRMRGERIRQNFPDETALSEMRNGGINRVISLVPITHSGLRLIGEMPLQEPASVYVYELDAKAAPFARWEKGMGDLRWLSRIPHRIYFRVKTKEKGTLTVLRNALPGWQLKENDSWINPPQSTDGWLRVPVTPGESQIDLRYLPPGLILGSIISGIGLLAFLGVVLIG